MSALAVPPLSGRRIRVLVVDDSALVRRLVREALEAAGDIEVVGVAPDPFVARERLLELAKLHEKSQLDSEDIAFRLAPRLNAAGRLGKAASGIELLTTADPARAASLADYVHELNAQRDTLERSIQLAAAKQAREQFDPEADAALVLAERGWHPGVIGIVAGRLAEKHHRPVVMLARDEHQGRPAIGSVRSVPGFDVHAALVACRDLLVTCGGHAAAAGLRIEDAKIDAFRERFLGEVEARMPAALPAAAGYCFAAPSSRSNPRLATSRSSVSLPPLNAASRWPPVTFRIAPPL
jgi:single-stranded-DNA-specific exonuclease